MKVIFSWECIKFSCIFQSLLYSFRRLKENVIVFICQQRKFHVIESRNSLMSPLSNHGNGSLFVISYEIWCWPILYNPITQRTSEPAKCNYFLCFWFTKESTAIATCRDLLSCKYCTKLLIVYVLLREHETWNVHINNSFFK